jgi:hypothetical protein
VRCSGTVNSGGSRTFHPSSLEYQPSCELCSAVRDAVACDRCVPVDALRVTFDNRSMLEMFASLRLIASHWCVQLHCDARCCWALQVSEKARSFGSLARPVFRKALPVVNCGISPRCYSQELYSKRRVGAPSSSAFNSGRAQLAVCAC